MILISFERGTTRTRNKRSPRERERPERERLKLNLVWAQLGTRHDIFVQEQERPEQGRSGYEVVLRRPDAGSDGDYNKRNRRADRAIPAETPEKESPRNKKQRKNKKKSKTIDPAEPNPEFKNDAGLFVEVGPSGMDDLHGNLIVNITWPFLQDEKPIECSESVNEFLYREGDERCVCDQMLQYDITPAAETAVCLTISDQYRDTDITVGSVCGKDKFDQPICFLNGCGDIISGWF